MEKALADALEMAEKEIKKGKEKEKRKEGKSSLNTQESLTAFYNAKLNVVKTTF